MDVIDYSTYSKEELFDVLQNIDHELYHQNALEAYQVLATNFGVKDDEIIDYFQDESLMSFLLKLCLFPFANNSACTGEEMREKIAAIKASYKGCSNNKASNH